MGIAFSHRAVEKELDMQRSRIEYLEKAIGENGIITTRVKDVCLSVDAVDRRMDKLDKSIITTRLWNCGANQEMITMQHKLSKVDTCFKTVNKAMDGFNSSIDEVKKDVFEVSVKVDALTDGIQRANRV